MDFPEKAIIGVLGDVGVVPVPVRVLGAMDRIEKYRVMAGLEKERQAGQTLFIASYDEDLLEESCDEILWIADGKLKHRGVPSEVLDAYRKHAAHSIRQQGNGHVAPIAPSMRRGDGRAKVLSIGIFGASGQPTIVWSSGEQVQVRVVIKFERAVDDPVIGMLIRTRIGLNVYGTNTELEKLKFGPCTPNESIEVTFAFQCELCPGEYSLTMASHDPDGVWHDWLEDAVAFSVTDSRYTAGVANLRAKVDFVRNLRL